jgi:ferrous-iron efflux pump FieF
VLETEGLHYSTDILTNAGVIGALLLARMTGQVFWDLLISLVIAGYLIFQVSKIAKRAVNELMDHEPSQALQQEIKSFVLKHNVKIIDIHDFRSRSVGDQVFAEFHITIKDETSFRRAHDLTEGLVQALHKKFPKLEVNIHYDPHGTAEPHRPELEE